ncbi:MAG TPA: pyrimidine/purine nucleosidase domain-containing protein, partial [Myxococcota bacterium]|nr:pyrimidine/purine nucleosidase domain-containing protein [Myxococcota bacterium]
MTAPSMPPNATKRTVRVVAALVESGDGRVLITQRRPQAFMPLKWEFPGGKVEVGETDQQALARELREELGIEVQVADHYMGLLHSYPEFDIEVQQQDRGIKIELRNAPATAFVDGEIIRGIAENLFAVVR